MPPPYFAAANLPFFDAYTQGLDNRGLDDLSLAYAPGDAPGLISPPAGVIPDPNIMWLYPGMLLEPGTGFSALQAAAQEARQFLEEPRAAPAGPEGGGVRLPQVPKLPTGPAPVELAGKTAQALDVVSPEPTFLGATAQALDVPPPEPGITFGLPSTPDIPSHPSLPPDWIPPALRPGPARDLAPWLTALPTQWAPPPGGVPPAPPPAFTPEGQLFGGTAGVTPEERVVDIRAGFPEDFGAIRPIPLAPPPTPGMPTVEPIPLAPPPTPGVPAVEPIPLAPVPFGWLPPAMRPRLPSPPPAFTPEGRLFGGTAPTQQLELEVGFPFPGAEAATLPALAPALAPPPPPPAFTPAGQLFGGTTPAGPTEMLSALPGTRPLTIPGVSEAALAAMPTPVPPPSPTPPPPTPLPEIVRPQPVAGLQTSLPSIVAPATLPTSVAIPPPAPPPAFTEAGQLFGGTAPGVEATAASPATGAMEALSALGALAGVGGGVHTALEGDPGLGAAQATMSALPLVMGPWGALPGLLSWAGSLLGDLFGGGSSPEYRRNIMIGQAEQLRQVPWQQLRTAVAAGDKDAVRTLAQSLPNAAGAVGVGGIFPEPVRKAMAEIILDAQRVVPDVFAEMPLTAQNNLERILGRSLTQAAEPKPKAPASVAAFGGEAGIQPTGRFETGPSGSTFIPFSGTEFLGA